MKITRIIDTAYHRNGICGAPFHVITFEDDGEEASRKLAILFDEPHHCAVLDIEKLHTGIIAFGQNSWRGDKYEPELRQSLVESGRVGDKADRGNTPVSNRLDRLFAGLLDEVEFKVPGFTSSQVDLLEKRFFEISESFRVETIHPKQGVKP